MYQWPLKLDQLSRGLLGLWLFQPSPISLVPAVLHGRPSLPRRAGVGAPR